MGKTHAIDYVCLHLQRSRPDVLTVRMSCEHHRSDFEGPFFSALLIAAGASGDALKATITHKRQELIRRLLERLAPRRGHIVVLFCDEAQRQSRNAYEWLRDVHDQLAYRGIRLITFLVGHPQLLAHKARFQMSGDEQIVARFMIEQLEFSGIRDAAEEATCLAGYDLTRYPEHGGPSFTGFFLPQSFEAGLRLEQCGADLWNAFVRAHAHAQLAGKPEIQMDYFTRVIESLLAQGSRLDSPMLKLDEAHWTRAVEESGYVAAARANAHRSMVGQYAGVAVFWSCRSFTPGPRRLCRPSVPVLARRRRAYACLGFVCAGSATGQNQVHTRDGRVCGGLNWR
jgi:hypothetical protein